MVARAARPVHVALGANLGDRRANLRTALGRLATQGDITAVSALYEAVPAGVVEQPPFLNAACTLVTALDLRSLLAALKTVEWELGRRPGPRWGPRPLDLDLLLAGDERVEQPDLTVPHARLAERAFVLAPLADIAAEAAHPVLHQTVRRLLA